MPQQWAISFYNSGAWKALRREILRRAHYTCEHCHRRAEHLHHIIELTPENIHNPMVNLNPENLQALCRDCHNKETKGCTDLRDGFIFDDCGQVVRR